MIRSQSAVSDNSATSVRVIAIRYEAAGISSFVLRRVDGLPFPAVDPGAHIEIRLPIGSTRSFSLSNGRADQGDYRLTVARDARSTGGSAFMHDNIKVGDVFAISGPRNNFVLVSDAAQSIFIAGGIGITPFVPMLVALNESGRAWKLIYFVKTRDRAALLTEIEALAAAGRGEVACIFTGERDGRTFDIDGILGSAPPQAHVYCCGPIGMLNSFRINAERHRVAPERVHFEYFSSEVEASTEGGFTVVLQRSGKEVIVHPGQTILEAIEAIGIDVPCSCLEGICGSCETKIISGIPDHRDMIYTERERKEAKTMMICCSGAKSARLVLDL
jgi:ferredoxin-NADP reductase